MERGVIPTGLANPLRSLTVAGGAVLGAASSLWQNDAGTSQFVNAEVAGTVALDAGAVFPGRVTSVRVGGGIAYFVVGDGSGCGRLCKAALGASTMTCDPGPVCAISLAAGDSLLTTTPGNPGPSLVQERARVDFSVVWQAALPEGLWGSMISCTPGGTPMAVVASAAGKVIFLSSDARGVDSTATWPMSGHDPSFTFNASTDLSLWSCP